MMLRSLSSGDLLLPLGTLAWMDTLWNAARKEVSLFLTQDIPDQTQHTV